MVKLSYKKIGVVKVNNINEEVKPEDKALGNTISKSGGESGSVESYNWGIGIGLTGVIISLCVGFYKMFVYQNNNDDEMYFSDYEESINAYVGGDAYNFIINASYSTAYFVLALMFMVLFCTSMILKTMVRNREN